jgi:hypothetical protein
MLIKVITGPASFLNAGHAAASRSFSGYVAVLELF